MRAIRMFVTNFEFDDGSEIEVSAGVSPQGQMFIHMIYINNGNRISLGQDHTPREFASFLEECHYVLDKLDNRRMEDKL